MSEFQTVMVDGDPVRFPSSMSDAEILAAIKSLSDKPGGVSTNSEAVRDFGDKSNALMDGLHNGMTLGFGDNLAGARGALFGSTTDESGKMARDYSGTMSDRYARERDADRKRKAATAEADPALATAGNLVGAMGPALVAAPLATGRTAAATVGRSGLLGMIEGALTGNGNADGENTLQRTGIGGLIGMILGIGAPVAVAAGARTGHAAGGLLDAAIGRGSQRAANREITTVLRRSGKTEAEINQAILDAAQDGQGMYTLMDAAGRPGQRSANGIARSGEGDASQLISDFLEQRQLSQGDRVAGFTDDAYGMEGRTAQQVEDAMVAARKADADVNYPAARGNAAPVDVTGAVDAIDDALRSDFSIDGGLTGLTETALGRRLQRIKSQISTGNYQTIDFDQVLETKQELGYAIEAIKKRGGSVPVQMGEVYKSLDAALEGASDGYRLANDTYRTQSDVIDAIEAGKRMDAPGRRAPDTTREFSAMTPEQKAAARVGKGDKILTRIGANPAPTSNKAKPLTSEKMVEEARAMALDPEKYSRQLARENEMWTTQNRALQGSQTANNLADMENTTNAAAGVMRAVTSPVSTAVEAIINKMGPIAKGQTDATRELIARALMSKDPQSVLGPALRQEMLTQGQRRVYEAILRNSIAPTARSGAEGIVSRS